MLILMTVAATVGGAQQLSDRFFDEYYFPFHPTTATSSGIHRYDGELEDFSRAAIARHIAKLKEFETAFDKAPAGADRDLLLSTVRSSLLELEVVKSWETDPDFYSGFVSSSAFAIMSRTFAPPDVRLRSLISRERKMPQFLAEARANLRNPPKVFTEVAIEQMPGIISFFEEDVPLAFAKVTEPKLRAAFKAANGSVISALRDYEKYLKSDLLPHSNGDYRLGAGTFARKLLYDEMVDIPLERLLKIGYDDLRQNQQRFRETAARIDKNKSARQILTELENEHPAPDKLLDAYRGTLEGLRTFIANHKIVTIPSPVLPILEQTPPFMRSLTSASMDTPGPYETVANEAFFNVTLPEKNWKPERVEDFMRGSHRGVILSTAIHEAYPGHYVQFLWMQHVDSRVRKLLGASSNAEGWAHYSEQMMLDEGFSSDPHSGDLNLKMRLGQLQDALLRDARFVVGIEMHTGKRTLDQSVEFFEKEAFQPHEIALKEAKRGTSDPTYLYYTLGKLQILKLREDYKKMRGAQFTLQEFHDRFMKEGFPPIKIVRKAMLGNDSPTL